MKRMATIKQSIANCLDHWTVKTLTDIRSKSENKKTKKNKKLKKCDGLEGSNSGPSNLLLFSLYSKLKYFPNEIKEY